MLCRFACCLLAIVTTDAAAGDGSMIEESGYPGVTRMAGVALIVTGYVLRVFTGRSLSIMTTLTCPENLCMIHVKYRCPEIDAVAVFTDLGCEKVLCRFTRCLLTIMTADAVAGDGSMIKQCRYPGIARMAGITLIVTGYVLRVFTCRFLPIVATLT